MMDIEKRDRLLAGFRRREHVVSAHVSEDGDHVVVKVVSALSGTESTVVVSLFTLVAWLDDEPIQVAFPGLTDDERELLLTGYTPEDRKKASLDMMAFKEAYERAYAREERRANVALFGLWAAIIVAIAFLPNGDGWRILYGVIATVLFLPVAAYCTNGAIERRARRRIDDQAAGLATVKARRRAEKALRRTSKALERAENALERAENELATKEPAAADHVRRSRKDLLLLRRRTYAFLEDVEAGRWTHPRLSERVRAARRFAPAPADEEADLE